MLVVVGGPGVDGKARVSGPLLSAGQFVLCRLLWELRESMDLWTGRSCPQVLDW